MTQDITNKTLQWARYELAAREAEQEPYGTAGETQKTTVAGYEPVARGPGVVNGAASSSREQAKRILEELTPLFAEQARIKRWSNMRPGKEPRLI